jgi:hypothetical protein
MMMVVEMTGGYTLLVPAAAAVMLSYLVQTRLSRLVPYPSIYAEQVPSRGESPAHDARAPDPLDVTDRREIKAALAGPYGSATRVWDKQDRVYLFVALPIVRETRIDGVPGKRVEGVVYVTRSTHDIKLQLYRLRSWLSRLLAASLIGTALLTLVLATTIARPLGRLTRRVDNDTSDGSDAGGVLRRRRRGEKNQDDAE